MLNHNSFCCIICNKKYKSASSLSHHKKRFHGIIEPQLNHTEPQLNHNEPQMNHNEPQLTFDVSCVKKGLKKTISFLESQECTKPYKCRFCNKHFTTNSHMRRHENRYCKSKGKNSKPNDGNPMVTIVNPNGNSMVTNVNILKHKKKDKKEYKCQYCKFSSVHRQSLYRHKKTCKIQHEKMKIEQELKKNKI